MLTGERESREEDGGRSREKKAGEEARGQTSVVSLFYGFHHMVSGGKRDGESRGCRKGLTRQNSLYIDFYLQDKVTITQYPEAL